MQSIEPWVLRVRTPSGAESAGMSPKVHAAVGRLEAQTITGAVMQVDGERADSLTIDGVVYTWDTGPNGPGYYNHENRWFMTSEEATVKQQAEASRPYRSAPQTHFTTPEATPLRMWAIYWAIPVAFANRNHRDPFIAWHAEQAWQIYIWRWPHLLGWSALGAFTFGLTGIAWLIYYYTQVGKYLFTIPGAASRGETPVVPALVSDGKIGPFGASRLPPPPDSGYPPPGGPRLDA